MSDPDFINQHKTTPTAFTRKRKLPFDTLCLYLLNLVKGASQTELDEFFSVFHNKTEEMRFVTSSALSQARAFLKCTAFEELNSELIRNAESIGISERWRKFRLLAVDSSALRLPDSDALRHFFGGLDNTSSLVPMARLSTCFDVNTGFTIDAQLAPFSSSERDLTAKHLEKTDTDDLILYDRGYPAFWLFSLHKSYSRDFCMRSSRNFSSSVKKFYASDANDAVISFTPSEDQKADCLKRGLPSDAIKLRAIKIPLSSGETEILLTTLLDKNRYPHDDFYALYGRRWAIEVDFNVKKNKLEIENFSGLSVHAVQQDVAAKILVQNIASSLIFCAQRKSRKKFGNRKHDYKVNISYALSAMKNFIVKVVRSGFSQQVIARCVDIVATTVEARRPGRSFQRNQSKIRKKLFPSSIKRTR